MDSFVFSFFREAPLPTMEKEHTPTAALFLSHFTKLNGDGVPQADRADLESALYPAQRTYYTAIKEAKRIILMCMFLSFPTRMTQLVHTVLLKAVALTNQQPHHLRAARGTRAPACDI